MERVETIIPANFLDSREGFIKDLALVQAHWHYGVNPQSIQTAKQDMFFHAYETRQNKALQDAEIAVDGILIAKGFFG